MIEAEGPPNPPEHVDPALAPREPTVASLGPDEHNSEPAIAPPPRQRLGTWAHDLIQAHDFILLVLLLSISAAGGSIAWFFSARLVDNPEVFVEVRTWGVHFALTPDSARDLVRFSRPRQGLAPDGRPYSGIPIRDLDSAPISEFVAAFGEDSGAPGPPLGEPAAGTAARGRTGVIQEFSVTAGCSVWLEPWLAGALQLGVHATAADGPPCRARARVFLDSTALDIPARTVTVDRSLLVRFTPDGELRFENLPVASLLRFDMHDGVELASGVITGRFRLTDWDSEDEELYPGDSFSLGNASGRITELRVTDALDVVFRGTASDPQLGDRSLSMSQLEAGWREYGERGTIVGVAVTFLLVGSATLQAIRRG